MAKTAIKALEIVRQMFEIVLFGAKWPATSLGPQRFIRQAVVTGTECQVRMLIPFGRSLRELAAFSKHGLFHASQAHGDSTPEPHSHSRNRTCKKKRLPISNKMRISRKCLTAQAAQALEETIVGVVLHEHTEGLGHPKQNVAGGAGVAELLGNRHVLPRSGVQ